MDAPSGTRRSRRTVGSTSGGAGFRCQVPGRTAAEVEQLVVPVTPTFLLEQLRHDERLPVVPLAPAPMRAANCASVSRFRRSAIAGSATIASGAPLREW